MNYPPWIRSETAAMLDGIVYPPWLSASTRLSMHETPEPSLEDTTCFQIVSSPSAAERIVQRDAQVTVRRDPSPADLALSFRPE